MQITQLRLATRDVAAQRVFYGQQLGLPLLEATAGSTTLTDSLTVQVGTTRLIFDAVPEGEPTYHLAFNIPRNKLAAAKAWLAPRVPLLAQGGDDAFAVASWDARMVYFRDPAGNILECIARQALPNDAPGAFGPHDLLSVSEIGLTVDDVPGEVAALEAACAITLYDEPSETFTALGDEHGLLIVVRRGRPWFPTETAAAVAPLQLTIRGVRDGQYHAAHLPYDIRMERAEAP